MKSIVASATQAAIAGLLISLVMLTVWYIGSGIDGLGFMSTIARVIHVLSAVLWVGMIWFVNFVQLAALAEADDGGRATLMKLVVPRVAKIFRHASTLTVLSGLALLISSGYLLERWVYKSAVYVPPLKGGLLLGAIVASLVIWALVHFVIWPSLRVVLGEVHGDAAAKARARDKARVAARINLVLALPVTCVMVAVSHA